MDSSQLNEASKLKGKGKGKGKSSAETKSEKTDVSTQPGELTLAVLDPEPSDLILSLNKIIPFGNEKLPIVGVSEFNKEDKNISSDSSNTVSVIVSNPKINPTKDRKSLERVYRHTADVKNIELAKKVLFCNENTNITPTRSRDDIPSSSLNDLNKVLEHESNPSTDVLQFAHTDVEHKQMFMIKAIDEWTTCTDIVKYANKLGRGCASSTPLELFPPDFLRDDSMHGSDPEDDCSSDTHNRLSKHSHADSESCDSNSSKKLCRKRYLERCNSIDKSPTKKLCTNDSFESDGMVPIETPWSSTSNSSTAVFSSPCSPDLKQWLNKYESWSSADKEQAINALIKISPIIHVRHMMKTIEPLFQTDFISLLPKELALMVLSYLEPKDLAKVSQTCRYWMFLANDYLLWKKLCLRVGITPTHPGPQLYTLYRPPTVNPFKWAFMNQHIIERNWMTWPSSEAVIMRGHDDHVITCLQCDGNRIVSGSDDTTLKVWSTVTGECLLTLVGHSGGVWSCQMTDDIIVSGSTDRTLRVWNADTGVCLNTLGGHTSTVRCMRLFEDKVVSGSRDATLRVWSIPEGRCLKILVGHMAAVRCVQYDGNFVVSGAYDFFVKVWNPDTGECLHTLAGHTNRVYSLQFDGINVVSGSLDTSICVWDATTGQLKHSLVGHTSLITSMELHGNILISGNADSTLKIWDITTGQCLHTLAGSNKHQSAVTYVQSTNRFVISSSDDGTVKLWDLRTGEFIRNIVELGSGGAGGNVLRIRASNTQLVCAVGSRNGTEETKLMLMDFDRKDLCEDCKHDNYS